MILNNNSVFNKKLVNILIMVFGWAVAMSQQTVNYGFTKENLSNINPSYFEAFYLSNRFKTNSKVSTTARRQWTKVDGAPRTVAINAETFFNTGRPNPNLLSHLYGISIVNDKAGRFSKTGIGLKGTYIFSKDVLDYGFCLGFYGGYQINQLDLDGMSYANRQTLLASNIENISASNSFEYSVGLNGYMVIQEDYGLFGQEDYLFGGISLSQLNGNQIVYTSNQVTGDLFLFNRISHINFNLIYFVALRDNDSYLQFSNWLQYAPNSPIGMDFNIKYQYQTYFNLSIGYNTGLGIGPKIGYFWENDIGVFEISYGTNFSLFNKVRNPFGYSHEITALFSFDRK